MVDFRGKASLLVRPEDLGRDAPVELRRAVAGANLHRFESMVKLSVWGVFGAMCSWAIPAIGGWGRSQLVSVGGVIVLVVMLGLMVATGMFFGSFMSRRRGITAVRACLRSAVCPSCGYSLAGVPAEEDGCVMCGECGGAWRVGDR